MSHNKSILVELDLDRRKRRMFCSSLRRLTMLKRKSVTSTDRRDNGKYPIRTICDIAPVHMLLDLVSEKAKLVNVDSFLC